MIAFYLPKRGKLLPGDESRFVSTGSRDLPGCNSGTEAIWNLHEVCGVNKQGVQTAIWRKCPYRESHRSSDRVPIGVYRIIIFILLEYTTKFFFNLFLVIICWQMFQDSIFRVWSTWCFLWPTAHPHWRLIYWSFKLFGVKLIWKVVVSEFDCVFEMVFLIYVIAWTTPQSFLDVVAYFLYWSFSNLDICFHNTAFIKFITRLKLHTGQNQQLSFIKYIFYSRTLEVVGVM